MSVMVGTERDAQLAAWRQAARDQLDWQAARAEMFQAYYDGETDVMALMDSEERRAFRSFLRESGANWCELIVNAVAERLQVTGFRFGSQEDNDLAWSIWQANAMDADAEMVQTDALVTGSGFVLVQPDDDNPSGVSITPESPQEATVLYEPGSRRRRAAGFKRYAEGGAADAPSVLAATAGSYTEILILPELIATWWPGEQYAQIDPNPLGEVGLIELVPQPRTYGAPRSELTPALVIQDRINTQIFARLVSADYGAFRQIWASGVRMARKVVSEGGQEVTKGVKPFDVGANRLLIGEDPAARFGSFPEATLQGFLNSVEQDVNQLAAITQTPPHYLLGQLVNLSADAIKAAEAGLVAKVGRRALHIGEGHEEVMRTALAIVGNAAAGNVAAEVVWRDFETRSESQLVDALVKMRGLGVPLEVIWERWGASPQEITRWKQLAAEEAATAPEAAYEA
ncbi:MAG: phage portal protein, partial [Actinobacteria bacterium]|nr:phage portal protein [Actinomycetota bacterium]